MPRASFTPDQQAMVADANELTALRNLQQSDLARLGAVGVAAALSGAGTIGVLDRMTLDDIPQAFQLRATRISELEQRLGISR